MIVDSGLMRQLTELNRTVNALPYVDVARPGEGYDEWKDTPDGGTWVCRDYVLAKAVRLRALGVPATDLAAVLCYTEGNEYHAVQGVRVQGDVLILDSRYDAPYYLRASPPPGYRWDRIQVAGTAEFEAIT